MNCDNPTILKFCLVEGHSYVLAIADVGVGGFVVHGVKLERAFDGSLHLGFPGRRRRNSWQLVCEAWHQPSYIYLLDVMVERFHYEQAAA